MRVELVNILSKYLTGKKSLCDVSEWFSCIDWNNIDIDSPISSLIGKFQLLVTEVSEGMRSESELWIEALSFVSNENYYWDIITDETYSWLIEFTPTTINQIGSDYSDAPEFKPLTSATR